MIKRKMELEQCTNTQVSAFIDDDGYLMIEQDGETVIVEPENLEDFATEIRDLVDNA